MSAFSIILRILTIGACLAALYLWTDKQQVIAQKEAIIQEREYLVGYPKMERPKGDDITMDNFVRKEKFALIQEDRPYDPSYQRLNQLRKELIKIQEEDRDYGHKGKSIGGYDPNKSLTLRTHIELQADDIQKKFKQIEGLKEDVEKLSKDLKEQKVLLGDEIQKVSELKETIVKKDAQYSDLNFKHEQFKDEYNKTLITHADNMENLKSNLGTQLEASRLQWQQLKAKESQLRLELAALRQQNSSLMHRLQNALQGTSDTQLPNKELLDKPVDQERNADPKPKVLKHDSSFYQFNNKTRQLVILSGNQSGIEKLEGKLLQIRFNNANVKGLQIVKVTDKFTVLLLPGKTSPKDIQFLQGLKSMSRVSLETTN